MIPTWTQITWPCLCAHTSFIQWPLCLYRKMHLCAEWKERISIVISTTTIFTVRSYVKWKQLLSSIWGKTWESSNSHNFAWNLFDSHWWIFGQWQAGTILWGHDKGHLPVIMVFQLIFCNQINSRYKLKNQDKLKN